MPERLQKILAEGGFGSRRECEQLILEGRVEVDREVVTQLGTRVDPEAQSIRVDGQKLKPVYKRYFAVNKPRGVLSTNKDPSGRPRVVDLIPTDQRVYTVGRLDKDSEGLIIVTNDGDLANQLTHPRYGVEKTYLIQVAGHPTREQMESLIKGVHLAEGFVQIKHFAFKRKQKHTTEIEIVLDEGRNREVRRLLARIGHKVLFLRRVAIGSFVLEGLPFGANRQLTQEEVAQLSVNPKRRTSNSGNKKTTKARPQNKIASDRDKTTDGPGSKTTEPGSRKAKPGTRKKKSTRPGFSTGTGSGGRSGSSSPGKRTSRKAAPKRKSGARAGSSSTTRSGSSSTKRGMKKGAAKQGATNKQGAIKQGAKKKGVKKTTRGKSNSPEARTSRRGQGRNKPASKANSRSKSRRR